MTEAGVATIPASEVKVGDVLRMGDGTELTVTRVEGFMFPGMLAFVEDSDVRWFKMLAPVDSEVTLISRAASPRRG